MHTASPYTLNVEDSKRDLIDPAVDGTRSVLNACARAGSVTRVVLTSSMAAITDEPASDHVLTEADWNMRSTLVRNPYYLSKTLAEKAAWAFIEHQRPTFDLVAVNPFMVIGPSLVASLNTSNQIFVELLTGRFPGVLDLTWGFVDVRDVAEAHLRAMERPGAHGRYICAAETASMRTVVDLLRTHGYSRYRLPRIPLDSPFGSWVVRQFSYAQGKGVGSYLRTHLGRVPRYDTTKIRTELGLTFRPIEQTVLDTVRDLERWAHLDRAGR
jgi:dihydroflavonol-4-reductase